MNVGMAALARAFDDGRDRAEFYRGWRMGLHAGLSHPATLSTMRPRGATTAALHAALLAGTREGRDITAILRTAAHLLEPFEGAVLRMGEESGQLESVLHELAEFHTRQHRLILKVRKHVSYPMFVSLVAVVIGPLPLVFSGRGGTYLVTVALGLLAWLTGGALVFARLAQRYQQRPGFVRARFARTLALTIGAGLPLPRALTLSAEASAHAPLVARIKRLGERTLSGQSIAESLAGTVVMTPEFVGMLQVAERSGDFASSLGRLAQLYEDGFK